MLEKIILPGLMGVAMTFATGAAASDYVVVRTASVANVDADTAWARIGDYCDISALLDLSCEYSAGTGGLGSVRSLNDGAIMEPMVAQTPHSYTYGQFKGSNAELDYHGTLAVEPAGPNQSRIVYTLVYDQDRIPDDAARSERRQAMQVRFQGAVDRAKQLAEAR